MSTQQKKQCEICTKSYDRSHYYRHMEKVHAVKPQYVKKGLLCPCSNCQCRSFTNEKLREHLISSHDVYLEELTLHFHTRSEFLHWLDKEEVAKRVEYVKPTSAKKLKDGSLSALYYCNRRGFERRRGSGKVLPRGSYKLDRACPSSLLVREGVGGDVSIKYYPTHMGHSHTCHNLLKHMPEMMHADISDSIADMLSFVVDNIERVPTRKQLRAVYAKSKQLYSLVKKISGDEGRGANDEREAGTSGKKSSDIPDIGANCTVGDNDPASQKAQFLAIPSPRIITTVHNMVRIITPPPTTNSAAPCFTVEPVLSDAGERDGSALSPNFPNMCSGNRATAFLEADVLETGLRELSEDKMPSVEDDLFSMHNYVCPHRSEDVVVLDEEEMLEDG